MLVLGIDPGDTTGFAVVSRIAETVKTLSMGEVKTPGFHKWLDTWDNLKPNLVVVEDFIKRPDFANNEWLKLDTAKKIGSIHRRARDVNATCLQLQPADKVRGYAAAGLVYKKGKKGMHRFDATSLAFLVATAGWNEKQRVNLD